MVPVRVLLVEDVSESQTRLRNALEANGYEVSCASSAPAGLLSLARFAPDVLVLDPLAGRGRADEWIPALERFRARRPLAVVGLARTHTAIERRALRRLADLAVVTRPVDPCRVLQALRDWALPDEGTRHAA